MQSPNNQNIEEQAEGTSPTSSGDLSNTVRHNYNLSNLAPAVGARHKKRRLGMGEGSGRGKTCGKGNKGHRSRSGYRLNPGFEGGQMPLHRRLPKSGFTSRKKVQGVNKYSVVSLSRLNIFKGVEVVTLDHLYLNGLTGKKNARVKILGGGNLVGRVVVEAHAVSRAAREAIDKAGGEVRLIPHNT